MDGFEQAFAGVETAAGATAKSAGDLTRLARQLEKAARDGNVNAIKRLQARLHDALPALGQTIENAGQSWPFDDSEVQQGLRDNYLNELMREANDRGLRAFERDGRLIVSPSIVRVMPANEAVWIDRKQSSNIRPSAVVPLLQSNQKRQSAYRSGPFLESLYKVYQELIREDSGSRLVRGSGQVVPLRRIYSLFTSLPGIEREYTRTDFARDLYLLEAGRVTTTRSGAAADFPASTGTRSPRDTFTFVDAEGRDITYYGIRFTEGS